MNILDKKWMRRHLEMARMVSTWSKDESTKVGCVIVTPNGLPVSWGYNGNPMGVKDTPERQQRPLKYHYVAHAERNAMDVCRRSVENCVMFITHAPCSSCAIGIAQTGIKTVVVDHANGILGNKHSYIHENEKWNESTKHSMKIFKETGIRYLEYGFDIDHSTLAWS